MSLKQVSAWRPQAGPQTALVNCPYREILYGGARGGGKTDGVLGKWGVKAGLYGGGLNAVFFRRTMPSQDDVWERAREIYGRIEGVRFHEQQHVVKFPNGGRIRFRPLERIADAEKYQGQNLSDAAVEEAGQYPDPRPIDRLFGALRSPHGVPTQLILTANPGGAGHGWLKSRYIDPAPDGMTQLVRMLPNGAKHKAIFIPSKVWDNRILLQNDPNYINNLHLVGSAQLVRAWLDGDWSAIEGAFFDCWGPQHVLRPFPVPEEWPRFRSMDWGSARPFSVGWWALVTDWHRTPFGDWLPRGSMVRYREWYGCVPGQPNTGLKMTAEQVAEGIKERDGDETIGLSVLDPGAFIQDGGPSIAERIWKCGVHFRRADNKRVSQRGAMGGWDIMRHRMLGDDFGEPYGKRPMIYCFSTCTDSIRTIPVLQHDEAHPEDVDTDGEDHAGDEWRYGCMSRPWIPTRMKKREPDFRGLHVGANTVTLDEFIRMNGKGGEERI